MKSHSRKHRNTGGVNEFDEDLKKAPAKRLNPSTNIYGEAEERKAGGRAKRKHGGMIGKKHVEMHGEKGECHAGRKPRKSGGRATSDANPFTSARHGTPAKGRKLEMEPEF